MDVQVSQLIPGYILTEDVFGKTKHPIMSKDTVLTSEHILILEKFSIGKVSVFKSSANRENLRPILPVKELVNEQTDNNQSFFKCYEYAISSYKNHFSQWQNNVPINMPSIREFLLPLIEYMDKVDIEVYQLHKYATKEDYFYHNGISVAILSAFLAKKLGYEKGEWIQIGLAGFLSNCGMAKIDSRILMKPGPLTYLEMEELKKHPTYSLRLVEPMSLIKEAVKVSIMQHHERLDGSGYPLGTVNKGIHLYAQIVGVCDTYIAMTSERLYQKRQSPFKAIDELKNLQFTKFNAKIVQTFIKQFINLSLGKKVELSNLQIGKITFIDERNPMSPLVLLEGSERLTSLEEEQALFINDFL